MIAPDSALVCFSGHVSLSDSLLRYYAHNVIREFLYKTFGTAGSPFIYGFFDQRGIEFIKVRESPEL